MSIEISSSWASWNPEALYLMVRVANHHAAEQLVKKAQRNLSQGGHNDTGNLSRSFSIDQSRYGLLGAEVEVTNTAPYAQAVDQGVDHDIFPHGNVLRFRPGKRKPRGAGGRFVPTTAEYLYRPYVRGQQATHFFTNAVNELSLFDFII